MLNIKLIRIALLIIITLNTQSTFAQADKFKIFDSYITQKYQKLINSNESEDYDVLNNQILNQLNDFLNQNPSSIQFKFDSLSNYINILTSPDSLFKVYSWYTYNGGTMHFYRSIFQFKNQDKVYLKVEADSADIDPDNYCKYFELKQLKILNKKVYIVKSVTNYSSNDYSYKIVAFEIDKNLLKPYNLFQTKNKLISEIKVNFEVSKIGEEINDKLEIKINNSTSHIFIPLINDDGSFKMKFLDYKFNGNYFKYVRVVKK